MPEVGFDVVVCGYGPTGLACASLLARRGHRVCVFERWPTLYGLPRMATIDGESARILQAASDVDAALRHSVPRKRYLFANENGEILIDHQWDKPHICGFPFRISLHQPDIEDAMDAAARERGAEINQGWEVCRLVQNPAFATVTARERSSGRERSVQAKYVIGADGARSTVRESLGIRQESWPTRNAWLTFDATRKRTLPNFFGVSPDGRVAAIFCVPGGRSHSIIPLGTDHLRFNFQTDPDTRHDGILDRNLAYRCLSEVYGIGEDDVEVYRQAVYPFEGKLAHTWRAGRIFLAGDAAHVMTPFLGQGGCSALRDAINLAWKLDLVLRGIASERLLDTYEEERKPHVRVHIDGSDKVGALAFISDPAEAAARDRLFLSGNAPPPPAEPTLVSGVLHPGDPLAGSLAPQSLVRHAGKEGRFDDLFGWGFQLIGWRCNPAEHLGADELRFLERIGTAVVGLSEENDVTSAYVQFFREHKICGLLARPDFVAFGVAEKPGQFSALVSSIRRAVSC